MPLRSKIIIIRIMLIMVLEAVLSRLWWTISRIWSRMARSTLEKTLSVSRWSPHLRSSCSRWPTNSAKCLSHMTARLFSTRWSKICWKWNLARRHKNTYLGRKATGRLTGHNHCQIIRRLSRDRVAVGRILEINPRRWLQLIDSFLTIKIKIVVNTIIKIRVEIAPLMLVKIIAL